MADWKGQAQDYGKINFDFVLMTHIQDINKQLSKLPHESILPNQNEPVGTTYEDIIKSYCNMVHQLAQLLKPYWDDTYKLTTSENETTFAGANMRFGLLMELCGRKNFLFTKIRENVAADNSA
jgi:hypothetical protein